MAARSSWLGSVSRRRGLGPWLDAQRTSHHGGADVARQSGDCGMVVEAGSGSRPWLSARRSHVQMRAGRGTRGRGNGVVVVGREAEKGAPGAWLI
jgi:hypothetical protein